MNADDTARAKLWSMIKHYRFAMLTTQEEDGTLRSRPMTTIEREYDGSLWFFARTDSSAAQALRAHPQVSLSYGDVTHLDFVAVAGAADEVTDVARKKELWKSAVQAWFPEGPESPLNTLIRVSPDHAEYWDSTSNKLAQLFSFARALATGKPPTNLGEHRNVDLSPESAP